MKMNHKNNQKNNYRRNHRKARLFKRLILSILIAIFITGLFGIYSKVEASSNPYIERSYYSYEIQSGDTLWSIANEYKEYTNLSTAEYVKELIRINQLKNSRITKGMHLIVFYYDIISEDTNF